MITEMAVARALLLERETRMAEAEKRRQHEFARTGQIAIAPKGEGVVAKVVRFVQSARPSRVEQAPVAGLAGEAAA